MLLTSCNGFGLWTNLAHLAKLSKFIPLKQKLVECNQLGMAIAESILTPAIATNILTRLKPATGYFDKELFAPIYSLVEVFTNLTVTIAVVQVNY